MTLEEWREKDCKMPLWQFLRTIHYYTELVKIYVVIGDAWLDDYKAGKKRRDLSDFWLTENAFEGVRGGGDYSEVERLLNYYADAPVWNICGEFTTRPYYDNHFTFDKKHMQGRQITSCITARVHFRDIRDAYYREKADIQREKRREYNRKRKEEMAVKRE